MNEDSASPPAGNHNLPMNAGPLIGRERELHELRVMLLGERAPLVTISGPGGTGKTSLALAVARSVVAEFPDGAVAVMLASLPEGSSIDSEVARALGVSDPSASDVRSRVYARLRSSRLLLLLDNAEHLPRTAEFVTGLLDMAGQVRVLVTSRVPLGLSREQEFALGALPVPAGDAPAALARQAPSVRLFEYKARAVKRDFELREDDVRTVAEICARLDGLPLAIELAAARIRVLPPALLLQHLHPSLALLTSSESDRPERHRSLRATLEWSERLLSPEQRDLWWTLGVFVGGASLEGVAAVSGVPLHLALDQLDMLVRHGLVRAEPGAGGEERFDLLVILREFVLERLVASGAECGARGRHARYFLDLARQADEALWSERQREVLGTLEREHGNLRAALTWALEHERELALDLAAALGNFWSVHGHLSEGRRWLELALRHEGNAEATVRALCALGEMTRMQGDHAEAQRLLNRGLDLARRHGDDAGAAASLNLLGVLAHNTACPEDAREFLTEALPLWERGRRDLGRTTPLFNLGRLALYWGDPHDAVDLLTAALAFWRATGNMLGVGYALYSLGRALLEIGDAERAQLMLRESLELREAIGDERGIIASRTALGLTAVLRGRPEEALPPLLEALERSVRLGHRRNIAECLEDCAAYAVSVGHAAMAVRLCAAGTNLREQIGAPAAPLDRRHVEATLKRARSHLSQASHERELRDGALLDPAAAMREAASLVDWRPADRAPTLSLTPRELEVLRHVAAGQSNRTIARALELSEKTVGRHVENIFNKLGVRTRSSAAAIAVREGLA